MRKLTSRRTTVAAAPPMSARPNSRWISIARGTRLQFAARLAIAAAPTVFVAAGCGGDSIPPDAAPAVDGAARETSIADGTPDNTTLGDAPDERSLDGTSDVSRSSDASDASDASVASDARDASAASDARDASATSDARDSSPVSDASDAADALNASDVDAGLVRDPRLGTTARFAVFAGSTVTNATGTLTTVTGDLGTYPDTTAIGPTPPVVVGAFQLGNLVAQTAAGDLVTLYNGLTPASMPGCTVMTGTDLGGQTLPPGIYCFSTSAQLTGPLILDAGNNPNAEWFFQIGSTLTTGALGAAPASVTMINGGNGCNVFWQVGSSATLDTGTAFAGNIVAMSSITLVTGTTLVGRALAESGGVTMDTNTVSIATCP
jgi:hypothetical protein